MDVEDAINHRIDERRLSGTGTANQEDGAMFVSVSLDERFAKDKVFGRFGQFFQCGQWNGENVQTVFVTDFLAPPHQSFSETRVIETWLLLAVLKVPIGGDGSNIQYFQGFVRGAAI